MIVVTLIFGKAGEGKIAAGTLARDSPRTVSFSVLQPVLSCNTTQAKALKCPTPALIVHTLSDQCFHVVIKQSESSRTH